MSKATLTPGPLLRTPFLILPNYKCTTHNAPTMPNPNHTEARLPPLHMPSRRNMTHALVCSLCVFVAQWRTLWQRTRLLLESFLFLDSRHCCLNDCRQEMWHLPQVMSGCVRVLVHEQLYRGAVHLFQTCHVKERVLCLRAVWRSHPSQTNWILEAQRCLVYSICLNVVIS